MTTKLGAYTRWERPEAITIPIVDGDGDPIDISGLDVQATWELRPSRLRSSGVPSTDAKTFACSLATDGTDGLVSVPWGDANPSPFDEPGLVEIEVWASDGAVRYASEIHRFTVREAVADAKPPILGSATGATGRWVYQGTWNANTNTPTLASGTGTLGDLYVVSTSGSTTLDDVTAWVANDLAWYDGTEWRKIDGTDFAAALAAHVAAADPHVGYLLESAAAATYQPLDADLTAIAAANNSSVLAATTASFLTADETKLDGIEAGADVTDTANVTAAGALMDSEVDADIKTLSLPANTTISTFGASLVDDPDAAAARTTLGAQSSADGSVGLVKLADITGPTVLGLDTGTGAPTELTPAQGREVLQVAGPVYDVRHFGAVLDGSTDDASAVAAALAALPARTETFFGGVVPQRTGPRATAGGGTVVIDGGELVTSQPISLPPRTTLIIRNATIRPTHSGNAIQLDRTGVTNNAADVHIIGEGGAIIDCDGVAAHGVYWDRAINSSVTGSVQVQNATSHGWEFEACQWLQLPGLRSVANGGWGIKLTSGGAGLNCNDISLLQPWAEKNTSGGLFVAGSFTTTIVQPTLQFHGAGYGLLVRPDEGFVGALTCVGGHFEDNEVHCAVLRTVSSVPRNVVIVNPGWLPGDGTGTASGVPWPDNPYGGNFVSYPVKRYLINEGVATTVIGGGGFNDPDLMPDGVPTNGVDPVEALYEQSSTEGDLTVINAPSMRDVSGARLPLACDDTGRIYDQRSDSRSYLDFDGTSADVLATLAAASRPTWLSGLAGTASVLRITAEVSRLGAGDYTVASWWGAAGQRSFKWMLTAGSGRLVVSTDGTATAFTDTATTAYTAGVQFIGVEILPATGTIRYIESVDGANWKLAGSEKTVSAFTWRDSTNPFNYGAANQGFIEPMIGRLYGGQIAVNGIPVAEAITRDNYDRFGTRWLITNVSSRSNERCRIDERVGLFF